MIEGKIETHRKFPKSNFETIVNSFSKNQYFGIENLFFITNTNFSKDLSKQLIYKSKNVSQLMYITTDVFISVIEKFSNDYEKFCEIKDRINSNNINYFKKKCPSC